MVYRSAHPRTTSGFIFTVAYVDLDGRRVTKQRANEEDALQEAADSAQRIAEGRYEAAPLTRSDRDELETLRHLAGKLPAVYALQQWSTAADLTDGHVVEAAKAWAAARAAKQTAGETELAHVVDDFIAAKEAAGKEGERTYRAKLRPLVEMFGKREISTVTATELTDYLERFSDGVTRNDHRKRAVSLFRWAQAQRRIPRGVQLEIEMTERAREKAPTIGILSPKVWGKLLHWCHAKQSKYLAALVLAGFCGLRADEIQGKRADREKRQSWEDVFIARKFVRVTAAKENTPSWRVVPLCPAAIAWLALCPSEQKGPVCDAAALEKLRLLARKASFDLPENCFRHSYISYRIPIVRGNKAQVATEAGNSVAQIDKHYRYPLTPADGKEWFGRIPGAE